MSAPASHEHEMSRVYSHGASARIVAAGGGEGLLNLGYAPPGSARAPAAQRQLALVNMVFAALGARAGEHVLDLGCGTGGTLALLARRAPQLHLTGVNVDRAQLGAAAGLLARRRCGAVRLVHADACALPAAGASFAAVYAIELSAHVDDKAALFREVARVLRPGGRFTIAYLTLNRPFALFAEAERAHLDRVAATFRERPESYATRTEYEQLGARAGLVLAETRDLTAGVFPPRHAEMLGVLRRIRSRAPWDRARTFIDHHIRWQVGTAALERFLTIHTERPAWTLFEYHLATWRKECARD